MSHAPACTKSALYSRWIVYRRGTIWSWRTQITATIWNPMSEWLPMKNSERHIRDKTGRGEEIDECTSGRLWYYPFHEFVNPNKQMCWVEFDLTTKFESLKDASLKRSYPLCTLITIVQNFPPNAVPLVADVEKFPQVLAIASDGRAFRSLRRTPSSTDSSDVFLKDFNVFDALSLSDVCLYSKLVELTLKI